jgi:hypothetical protein
MDAAKMIPMSALSTDEFMEGWYGPERYARMKADIEAAVNSSSLWEKLKAARNPNPCSSGAACEAAQ